MTKIIKSSSSKAIKPKLLIPKAGNVIILGVTYVKLKQFIEFWTTGLFICIY